MKSQPKQAAVKLTKTDSNAKEAAVGERNGFAHHRCRVQDLTTTISAS